MAVRISRPGRRPAVMAAARPTATNSNLSFRAWMTGPPGAGRPSGRGIDPAEGGPEADGVVPLQAGHFFDAGHKPIRPPRADAT